jgi:hypothetical protein
MAVTIQQEHRWIDTKKQRHGWKEQAGVRVGFGCFCPLSIKLVMESQPQVMPLDWKTGKRTLPLAWR